ncbi:MAG: YraN family protein [Kiritimatiellia bacterium]
MRLPWPFSLFLKKRKTRPESHRAGAWGEQLAADFLEKKGYKILGRNVRFGSRCELDVVARSPAPEALVFVEVKTRRTEDFGRPFSAVDRGKRRAVGRAAMRYLRRIRAKPAHVRFDVVEVVGTPGDETPIVRHVENAFSPGPGYRLPW